ASADRVCAGHRRVPGAHGCHHRRQGRSAGLARKGGGRRRRTGRSPLESVRRPGPGRRGRALPRALGALRRRRGQAPGRRQL
ncbi:MAG: hypothetical protein AVDCRST_MAG57-1611, partial [uncultured Blastococcus sp.]